MDNKGKANTFSVETLQQLLKNEQSKVANLRNKANESFQEYQHQNLTHLRADLLRALLHLAHQVRNPTYRQQPLPLSSATSSKT